MLRDIGVHRVDETDVVDTLCRLRKNVTYPFAGLSVLLEPERRWHQSHLGVAQRFSVYTVWSLACMLRDQRLVVERVDLRWAARHEELNDAFSPGCEVGCFRRQWGDALAVKCARCMRPQYAGQSDAANPGSHFSKRLAA